MQPDQNAGIFLIGNTFYNDTGCTLPYMLVEERGTMVPLAAANGTDVSLL